MHHMDADRTYRETIWWEMHKSITNLYWTNPGSNTPWNYGYTNTYFPSLKPFKLDEQYIRDSKSKDKLIIEDFQWTHTHGRAIVGWPARTYLHQLFEDTECSLEDMPGAMDSRDGWG